MICGTMTSPYLFRIHLFGVGAKVEDSIISGLVTRQGGYETGKSGSWAIAFPHALLGISGDYSGNSGKMDWGPAINGNTTRWSASGAGSDVRVIAIGY